jgi:hypothetical protein
MRAAALAQTAWSPGAARHAHRPWSLRRARAHGGAVVRVAATNWRSELHEFFTYVDRGARGSRRTRFWRQKPTEEDGPRRGGKEEVARRRLDGYGGSRRSVTPR